MNLNIYNLRRIYAIGLRFFYLNPDYPIILGKRDFHFISFLSTLDSQSPKLPLTSTDEDGPWGLNKTLLETTKQNFKNLLLTNPGERVMDTFFGVGLSRFLFAQVLFIPPTTSF